MNKEARKILYDDLKEKGLTHAEANKQLKAWDSDVDDLVAEKKEEVEDRAEPRHGTTCVGIVAKKKGKGYDAVAEW